MIEANRNEELAELEEKANGMEHLPCCIKNVNSEIIQSITNASNNLKAVGFKHQFIGGNGQDFPQSAIEKPLTTSLGKAVDSIRIVMKKLGHRLCNGLIYSKHPKGNSVFIKTSDLNYFLNLVLRILKLNFFSKTVWFPTD